MFISFLIFIFYFTLIKRKNTVIIRNLITVDDMLMVCEFSSGSVVAF